MEHPTIVKTPLGEIYAEAGILYITFTNEDMRLEDAKVHVEMILENFADVLPLPTLVNNGNLKNSSKEARDYFAGPDMAKISTVLALLINSSLAKIAGNLFLQFNKPNVPTKLFTDRAKALEWLNTVRKKG